MDEELYDIIIIGAGPCGLATAARLRELTPAAVFTDEEHRRYHWIGKHGSKVSLKHVRSGKTSIGQSKSRPNYSMLVIDSTDNKWMGRWNKLFATYDITNLRSPILWHVDPLERDSLLAHAYECNREDELVEIKNCVGKEISKHARKKMACRRACGGKQDSRIAINLRERNDYYTPSQSLFCDHCEQVADRYKLSPTLLRKEVVQNIDYGIVRGYSVDEEKIFTVTTGQTTRFAKTVIMAVGPANTPDIPRVPSMKLDSHGQPRACHSAHIQEFPASVVQDRIDIGKDTNIVVVGGGLTSAQLSDLAIRRGVTRVWHIMRGPCRVKHFDVDLQWVGKYKNAEQARFWSADSEEERLQMLKSARGGGSMTPLFNKRLRKHADAGKLFLYAETQIIDAKLERDGQREAWKITAEPPISNLPPIDYIYFATGVQTDFTSLPYLQTMLQKYPIEGRGGFPCLNEDLMWKDGVPLFMVGKLAALQLGPAAPNLGGAKLGAERVAWAIEDMIRHPQDQDVSEQDGASNWSGYMSGHGNMYSALSFE